MAKKTGVKKGQPKLKKSQIRALYGLLKGGRK